MKKKIKILVGILLAPFVVYFSLFYVLGWLAPKNTEINEFYSSKFYELRKWKESEYLNQIKVYEGKLYFDVEGEPGLTIEGNDGVGFRVPDYLDEKVRDIAADSKVRIRVGKELDRKSIGIYWNQLRDISIIESTTSRV